MGAASTTLVLHHSASKGMDRLVMLAIAEHDGEGGAWPSLATIARLANCSESTVKRAIRELVSLGELRVMVNGGGTGDTRADRRPNRYDLLLACPPGCDGTMKHRVGGGGSSVTPGQDAGGLEGDHGGSFTTPRGVFYDSTGGLLRPPNPPSRTLLSEPSVSKQNADDSGFDEFWDAFGLKNDKVAARKAWRSAIKVADPQTIIDGARRYRAWLDSHPNPPSQKYAQGWLNGRRWEDELEPVRVHSVTKTDRFAALSAKYANAPKAVEA